jgi:hypothetical protein
LEISRAGANRHRVPADQRAVGRETARRGHRHTAHRGRGPQATAGRAEQRPRSVADARRRRRPGMRSAMTATCATAAACRNGCPQIRCETDGQTRDVPTLRPLDRTTHHRRKQ